MKILIAFGTRPEIIKLAPVILELRKHPRLFKPILLATAQHRGLLDQMLQIFDLKPDLDLDIMKPNQRLDLLTSELTKRVGPMLDKVRPDLIMVQGDTTTAMATALVAFYGKIPIAHIEAGLRTGDIYFPFPEEINRRIISELTTWHFAPTNNAARNLKNQGVQAATIFVTGNTVVDALLHMAARAQKRVLPFRVELGKRLVLATIHRRESFGRPFVNVCRALRDIVRRHSDVVVAYPVHPNPNIRVTAREILGGENRVLLLPPLNYLDFLALMIRADLILTDSGGIQEEAPTFHKPVLVLREETERPEGIAAGIARLVGTERYRIVEEASRILGNAGEHRRMAGKRNPYGDGKAARRIVDVLTYKMT